MFDDAVTVSRRREFQRFFVDEDFIHNTYINGVVASDCDYLPTWKWVGKQKYNQAHKLNLVSYKLAKEGEKQEFVLNGATTRTLPALGGEILFFNDEVAVYDKDTVIVRKYLKVDKMFHRIKNKLSLVEIDKRRLDRREDADRVFATTIFFRNDGFHVTWTPSKNAPGKFGQYQLGVPDWASVVAVAYSNNTDNPGCHGVSVYYNKLSDVVRIAEAVRNELKQHIPGHGIF